MIEFLIVQLSSSSTSFCHYKPGQVTEELISIDYLRSAILFSMKENLKLQVLYPDRALPVLSGLPHGLLIMLIMLMYWSLIQRLLLINVG